MDNAGQYFLINKHLPNGKKKRRRHFFTAEEISQQIELAKKYAEENGEDYLIVQVVQEISEPKKASADA